MANRNLGRLAVMVALGTVAVASLLVVPSAIEAEVSVVALKVQVIERLTQFVEWPAASMPASGSFVVCLYGDSEIADELERLARARKFKDRSCDLRRVRPGSSLGQCHLLYIARGESSRLEQILGHVSSKPVLTVSDELGFAERGVLVNLSMEGRYVRLHINLGAVERSRLFFSSKLLRLAKLVGA